MNKEKKEHWSEDKKNLGTTHGMSLFFLGFGIISIVIGSKHVGIHGTNLTGAFAVVMGILFLLFGHYSNWDYIEHLKEKNETNNEN